MFAINCSLQPFNKYGTVLNSQFVHPNFIVDRELHSDACSCCMLYFLSKYTLKSNLILCIYSFARFHTWVMSSPFVWEFIFLPFITVLKYLLGVKYCRILNWPIASEKRIWKFENFYNNNVSDTNNDNDKQRIKFDQIDSLESLAQVS